MGNSDEKVIYNSGEKPPEGTYTCMSCGSSEAVLMFPGTTEKLPVCPVCGCTMWMKV